VHGGGEERDRAPIPAMLDREQMKITRLLPTPRSVIQ
jgi:hypothetical protein